MVAPSFQKLEIVGEPFEENKKQYVYVKYNDGHTRKVRWYEEPVKKTGPLKDVIGFKNGPIYLVKGNIGPFNEWLRESTARYRTFWGWAFESDVEIPTMPEGLSLVELTWDMIADVDKDELKPEPERRKVLESLLYDPSDSKWQGEIGDRIDRTLTVAKVTELPNGFYGPSTFYLFTDEAGNEYCWTTAAKKLEAGRTYEVRGTIKTLQIYKGKEQTVLTRCRIN